MSLCTILFLGLALFFSCLIAHIALWRLFPARRGGLVTILVLWPVIAFILAFAGSEVLHTPLLFSDPAAFAMAYILHLTLSGSYLFVYTALAGPSPSIGILTKVNASMPRGLQRQDLAPEWFTDDNLSGARLRNMVAAGLVLESANSLRLSSRGWAIASCFLVFRRFLGLQDIAQG